VYPFSLELEVCLGPASFRHLEGRLVTQRRFLTMRSLQLDVDKPKELPRASLKRSHQDNDEAEAQLVRNYPKR
jgi:hypothetical protein